MDSYTRETRGWLERRFELTDDGGLYVPNGPAYAFSMLAERLEQYARFAAILDVVRTLKFDSVLEVGDGYQCTVGAARADPCLQSNVVTATAVYAGAVYSDSDPVYYYGVPCGATLDQHVFLPLVLSRCCPGAGAPVVATGTAGTAGREALGTVCPP